MRIRSRNLVQIHLREILTRTVTWRMLTWLEKTMETVSCSKSWLWTINSARKDKYLILCQEIYSTLDRSTMRKQDFPVQTILWSTRQPEYDYLPSQPRARTAIHWWRCRTMKIPPVAWVKEISESSKIHSFLAQAKKMTQKEVTADDFASQMRSTRGQVSHPIEKESLSR